MAGMEEARRIEQDAVDAGTVGPVDRRHRLAFGVGVEDVERHAQRLGLAPQKGVQFLGGRRAVQLGLAPPEIFHVGALDQQQLH